MVLKAYPHHMHCYTIKNRGKLILFNQLSSILFGAILLQPHFIAKNTTHLYPLKKPLFIHSLACTLSIPLLSKIEKYTKIIK